MLDKFLFPLRGVATAIASSVALLSVPAAAQDKGDDTVNLRVNPISEIEVTADRILTRKEVMSDVYELAQSNQVGQPVPRFHDPLCLRVSGLGEVLNRRVSEAIEGNARDVDLEIDEPGCIDNALVLVVDNPARLIERMREWEPLLFSQRANREIRAALYRKDPVIGFSRMGIRNSRGGELTQNGAIPGLAGGVLFDNPAANVPRTDAFMASRTFIPFSRAREVAVVVFDVRRLENVHINQLADYATMYLIGSPRRLLDHDKLAGSSILTLFNDGPLKAPLALTKLDRAYLRGLYAMRPNENSTRLKPLARIAYEELSAEDACADEEACVAAGI